MIEKERLQELIEQGATVWNDEYGEIKLDKDTSEVCEVRTFTGKHMYWCLSFMYVYEGVNHTTQVNIEDLEEDIEKGKWQSEYGNIIRPVRLDLPTWEQIEADDHFSYVRYYHISREISFFIHIYKFTKSIEISGYYESGRPNNKFEEHYRLNKEEYLEACARARELFLGGKNE